MGNKTISFDPPFVCQRSGMCCEVLAADDHWERSDLTKSEVEELVDTRKEYPINTKGCGMLVYNGNAAICLVESEMGYDKKHSSCRQYPETMKPCLRQILKKKDQRKDDMHKAVMETYERKIGKVWSKSKADDAIAKHQANGNFDKELSSAEDQEARDL